MPIATFPLESDHAELEISDGTAYLEWPERVTAADISDLREWVEIIFRIMERKVAATEGGVVEVIDAKEVR